MRYSRFFPLGHGRRLEVQGEFKNVFNIAQPSGVSNTLTVDTAGYPLAADGVTRLDPHAISLNGSDYAPTGGLEQRKFQLGFKFHF